MAGLLRSVAYKIHTSGRGVELIFAGASTRSTLPSWLLPGSARDSGVSALASRAHAPSRARARRRGGGRLSPSPVAAHGDRLAPTPTRRAATLGRQAARHAAG